MRTVSFVSWVVTLMFGAMAWNPAAAQSVASSPSPAPATLSTSSGQAGAKPVYVDGFGKSVDSALLAKSSGGTDVSEEITLNGTVSNNSSDHVVTGSNVIGNGAFDGSTGLPTVIQNTGNGVLIQNATIINVQFKP